MAVRSPGSSECRSGRGELPGKVLAFPQRTRGVHEMAELQLGGKAPGNVMPPGAHVGISAARLPACFLHGQRVPADFEVETRGRRNVEGQLPVIRVLANAALEGVTEFAAAFVGAREV